MMLAIIIACEVLFWVFVLAGLVCRYILRMPKLGATLLFCTPIIDILLLITTSLHLKNGATADFVHGLAAIYIGVSIAFGHSMIKWADVRFAHRFAGGPAPTKKPKYGAAHARHLRIGWLQHLLAWVIGCLCLYGVIWYVGAPERTEPLKQFFQTWTMILGIDFLISFSYTLWPRKDGSSSQSG
jgi:hypothetical protein